jgi:hypothetical protein
MDTDSVALCPLVKRVSHEGSKFVGDSAVCLTLDSGFCLEATKSEKERGAVVCTEAMVAGNSGIDQTAGELELCSAACL